MPTTAQKINTLLHYLTLKHQPPFPILFWSELQKIDFDYSPTSVHKISQFFAQLGQKHIDLPKILAQPGGDNFLLAIASYIAKTLSVYTHEEIFWYDFEEINKDIAEQNQLHNTDFSLLKEMGSSFVTKIGDVYCQPLRLLPGLLNGEKGKNNNDILTDFMTEMEQAIFAKAQVNLFDNANNIAKNYLIKIKTGKLLDKSIGFYPYIKDITFDFSRNSLVEIDKALANIAQTEGFTQNDYTRVINEPENQAFFYLLGFYLGATSSKLSNVASKWADYDEMMAILGDAFEHEFSNCIEQRFVQLMENHYRMPILVITNRLFNISPNFPKLTTEFTQIIDKQNRGELHIFSPKKLQSLDFEAPLPKIYQQATQTAGQLLTTQLKQMIMEQQPIVPKLIQVDSESQQTVTLSSMDSDIALDRLHEQLANQASGLLYQVASFGLLTNLALGQFKAIAIEIHINPTADNEALALQVILPYRIDDAKKKPNEPLDKNQWLQYLVLYPFISNQKNLPAITTQLLKELCRYLPTKIWQACAVERLTPWEQSPFQQAYAQKVEQVNKKLVNNVDIKFLPLGGSNPALPAVGSDLKLPDFDYSKISWQGYNFPKYIIDTPQAQREYLQVVVPNSLVGDILFTQVENLHRIYRYGKVVWGIVIANDIDNNDLYNYDDKVTNVRSPNELLTVDIVYDPTGQASVAELQQATEQLQSVLHQPVESLPSDQAIYTAHCHDTQSRVFAFNYPQSLQKNTFKISTTWVWRLHLPNGMLSKHHVNVVPIVFEPETPNQPMTSKGRIIILPSRYWSKELYQNWLSTASPTASAMASDGSGDLMPIIKLQEQQGYRYLGRGLDARLFPKFKFDVNQATLSQSTNARTSQTYIVSRTNPEPIPSAPNALSPNASASTIVDTATIPMISSQPTSQPISMAQTTIPLPITKPQPMDSLIGLSPELQQELAREQARLQSALSTRSKSKEKVILFLIILFAAVIVGSILYLNFMNK